MTVSMAKVLANIRKHKYYRNEDVLNIFISKVESGITPPDWMLQFMADGAREFLKGGKPWQKEGGRPSKPYGPKELTSYLLSYYGGLSAEKVATVLGETDDDGVDRVQTMRRTIKRGSMVFFGARMNSPDLIKAAFSESLDLEFADLTPSQRRKCRDGLRAGLADIERDDIEPNYEPIYT